MVLFTRLSKSFDSLNQHLTLRKLKYYGLDCEVVRFKGRCLSLIGFKGNDRFTKWKQRMIDALSQGITLSPLFWISLLTFSITFLRDLYGVFFFIQDSQFCNYTNESTRRLQGSCLWYFQKRIWNSLNLFLERLHESKPWLTHLFPIHLFSTPWKQKNLRFSDVFRK